MRSLINKDLRSIFCQSLHYKSLHPQVWTNGSTGWVRQLAVAVFLLGASGGNGHGWLRSTGGVFPASSASSRRSKDTAGFCLGVLAAVGNGAYPRSPRPQPEAAGPTRFLSSERLQGNGPRCRWPGPQRKSGPLFVLAHLLPKRIRCKMQPWP